MRSYDIFIQTLKKKKKKAKNWRISFDLKQKLDM